MVEKRGASISGRGGASIRGIQYIVICDSTDVSPGISPLIHRAQDMFHIFLSIMCISSPNSTFDHLLESSHRDDSDKWSNIGFGEEIMPAALIEVNFMLLI